MEFHRIEAEDTEARSILVVDDDPLIRRYLEAQLGRLGCRMLFAASGAEAMEVLEREHPDLVLLDIVMPGMDGLEVCRRIKGSLDTCDIPVIHLTALKGEAKENSFAAGADDFLNKPPNFVELRSRIRSHLLIRSLQAERRKDRTQPRAWNWEATRKTRILLVENQPALREMVADELQRLGHEVRAVEGLQGCLKALGEGLPDLLVIEHRLDDGDGAAFAAHLRNFVRSHNLPVLVLCARAALEKEIPVAEAGPIDYLTKPFQPAELRVRISVLLRHGALLREHEANTFSGGKQLLMDPQTGAFTDAFLEAHLDLLQKVLNQVNLPVALVAAGCYGATGSDSDPTAAWGEGQDHLAKAAGLLNGSLLPGESLCRVAERTFVMVLPGQDREQLDVRLRDLRRSGFQGALVGMMVPRKWSASAILRNLAQALQRNGALAAP